MKLLNKKADQFYMDYARTHLQKIEVVPGNCRLNYKCMYNAVHDAIKAKQKEIAMVVYIENGIFIIHFLNIVQKNGKEEFVDNTLGVWSGSCEFYLVKRVQESEFWNVGAMFSMYQNQLRSMLPFWTKLLSDSKG